jgi:hypothetical protein
MEMLVVSLIFAVLIGLLIPAVISARDRANRAICGNNLRQVGEAFIYSGDQNEGLMPPLVGYYPFPQNKSAFGTALFHILPYVGQGTLYEESNNKGDYSVTHSDVFTRPVKLFICPSDETSGDGVVYDMTGRAWGASSYAANAQVFAQVRPMGEWMHFQGYPSLNSTFGNGTSNMILLAEKYANCQSYAYPEGGTCWAYWLSPSPKGGTVSPLHPGFAISWMPYSIGPQSKFLVRPPPGNCDPTLASTPHRGGMQVFVADGSVRTLAPSMSGETWWAACNPYANDSLDNDW